MADLRIVDAPEIPTENITGEEKLPTGGNGNYSISLDSLADYTKTKKDLADNTSVDGKVNGVRQELDAHIEDLLNPHQVTKGQIGLGNVDNTADADKPVSNSTQAAIISAVTPKADKTYVDTQLTLKANKADVYTKLETYTKQESNDLVNNSVSTALTPVNTSLELAKRGVVNRYNSSLTYNSGERVVLTNGDIVKNTVDGNANDPNSNMTGWVKTNSASQIFDESGLSQQEWNNGVPSVAAMRLISTPRNGSRVSTVSYHDGLDKGGATYVFDLSKVGIDNGITIIKGWVLQLSDRICITQAGCKLDDVNDDSIQFNACSDLNLAMSAKVSGRMRCLSPLRLNLNGFIGSGMFFQINVIGGHDGIILPLGGGRLFQNIEKFSMISSDNSAQNHFAIRSQEITNPETQPLGNGFKIRDIEIGGGGRFGCGIALTDCFRASINDIGMTSCANAVVLYGRVVQCKVGVITSNSDEFEPVDVNSTVLNKLTALPETIDKTKRYGLLVTGSTHTGTYQYPESIKSRDNSYVKHDYGLYHYDGLFCSYKDIDLDYNLINGAYFYSCNGLVTLDTCWLAQNVGASHGIVIETSTAEAKRLILNGIYGLSYGELIEGSAVVYQSSNGVSVPARRGVEVNGVTLASNYWTRGIDFNRMKDFTIKNFIEEGTAIDKGVSLLNCENFKYTDSISALSNIHTPTGEFEVSRIAGEVSYNFLDFSTADKSRPNATTIQNKPLEMQGIGGAWKAPIKFEGGFLWITLTGKLMKKVGATAPTSDTDGVEIT